MPTVYTFIHTSCRETGLGTMGLKMGFNIKVQGLLDDL